MPAGEARLQTTQSMPQCALTPQPEPGSAHPSCTNPLEIEMKKRITHPSMARPPRSTRPKAPFRSPLFQSLALVCLSLFLLPDSATAQIRWGNFQKDQCTKLGHRQYASVLHGIPFGVSWEDTCAKTSATIGGQHFARPTRCVNKRSVVSSLT